MQFWWLKAVAVSDTINAVILVIGALLVPVFALLYLGNGSISERLNIITTTHVEKWNAIGSSTDSTPLADNFYRYYGCSLLLLDNGPSHRTTLF